MTSTKVLSYLKRQICDTNAAEVFVKLFEFAAEGATNASIQHRAGIVHFRYVPIDESVGNVWIVCFPYRDVEAIPLLKISNVSNTSASWLGEHSVDICEFMEGL